MRKIKTKMTLEPVLPILRRGADPRGASRKRMDGTSRYSLRTSNGRTSNEAEIELISALEDQGWTVLRNGWPDLLIHRAADVRAIEVKPTPSHYLKPRQQAVADVLALRGIEVGLWYPGKPIPE